MKLSVIIVSYNVRYYLEQCLWAVIKSARGIDCEIILVDNASADDTPAYIRSAFPTEQYPMLQIVANKDNVGFGQANNQAVQLSKGEYVLFLNPDTLLTESTLHDCLTFLDSKENPGCLGVRMLHPNGSFAFESRRGVPTPFTSLCKILRLSRLFPHSPRFGRYHMRYLDEHQANKIEIVSGAFMMVRRSVLNQCGTFDEDFFMYGEDIDLSYRILTSGHQNYYIPSPILHYKGESTNKTSYRYVHVFYQAMVIFFDKHFSNHHWWITALISLAVFCFEVLAFISLQIGCLIRHISTSSKVLPIKYLFIGSEEMLADARKMCDHWSLWGEFVKGTQESLPQGHLSPGIHASDFRYVVYDIESYAFGHVLSIFDKAEDRNNYIGTYYLTKHMMITHRNIFLL